MTGVEPPQASTPAVNLVAELPSEPTEGNTLTGSVNAETKGEKLVNEAGSINVKASDSDSPSHARTRKQTIVSRFQFAAVCWSMFMLGWHDGSTGPLLPRIRETYQVSYAVVSLIFILSCVGLLSAALANVWLTDRLGYGKVVVLGAALQVVAFSVQSPQPPFAVFVIFCVFNGFGGALQDAQTNGYVGALKTHAETKMGFLHAFYGLGAFVSPWVATEFSKRERWSHFYLVSLGVAVTNTIFLAIVFRGQHQKACLLEAGEVVEDHAKETSSDKFMAIMKNMSVHFMGIFILFYVGLEVTLGSWIVTYIIEVRGGGPSSGYVSAGFFGGLMLGRVILLPVNKFLGERRALFLYGFLSLGLDFVIWFVPSLIGGAVTVSIIGILLGPLFPIAMNQCARFLPPSILTGAIGWVAGFGYAGAALIPFITGAIADGHGIKSMHPVVVAMITAMLFFFWLTPAGPTKSNPEPSSDSDKGASEKEVITV